MTKRKAPAATTDEDDTLAAATRASEAARQELIGARREQRKIARAVTDHVGALEESATRLASRLADAEAQIAKLVQLEERVRAAESELALINSGLAPAQVNILRRLLAAEKPSDVSAWVAANAKEMR